MRRMILLSAATLVLLVDGFVYGLWTDRWGNAQVVQQAVVALDRVPLTIGDWQAQPVDMGAKVAAKAGFAGYWLRRYERRADGAIMNVMLACGRPGPLSVHTPDVCYAASGFTQAQPAVKHAAASGQATQDAPPELWKTKFSKRDALVPVSLRVFWTWRLGDTWQAPSNPRFGLASQPVVYKMYVTHEMTGMDEPRDEAVCAEFINVLLPALDRALTASP